MGYTHNTVVAEDSNDLAVFGSQSQTAFGCWSAECSRAVTYALPELVIAVPFPRRGIDESGKVRPSWPIPHGEEEVMCVPVRGRRRSRIHRL